MLAVIVSVLLLPVAVYSQFPAVCNDQTLLDTKTCCPDNCGGSTRGSCMNITQTVVDQWNNANQSIVDLLKNSFTIPEKNTADSRYRWPTVVFEKVCNCSGNYGGYNCLECDFGWTGDNCQMRKVPVIRKSFNSLTDTEKNDFISATRQLKTETGVWSVIVSEPLNYDSGTVTLQNVPTYDMFIFVHSYVARDDSDACKEVNKWKTVDFAHEGPVFPVWHRRYLLIIEREYQRIMDNPMFGLPYWQWEENELSLFDEMHFGDIPSNVARPMDVSGILFDDWYTICDLNYREKSECLERSDCARYWNLCNPANDLAQAGKVQRGRVASKNTSTYRGYLPSNVEVKIAIAAPVYDDVNSDGNYETKQNSRRSFRSRLEGTNRICSEQTCVTMGVQKESHMHNAVHLWFGGHMEAVPAASNDPIFNIHHCNIDRIFESWIKRFSDLPAYEPVSEGHPGHNQNDFMVPFFPLITADGQYKAAEEWGYTYDSHVVASLNDNDIGHQVCSNELGAACHVRDSSGICFDCKGTVCPETWDCPDTPPPVCSPTFPETCPDTPTPSSQPSAAGSLGFGLALYITFSVVFIDAIVANLF